MIVVNTLIGTFKKVYPSQLKNFTPYFDVLFKSGSIDDAIIELNREQSNQSVEFARINSELSFNKIFDFLEQYLNTQEGQSEFLEMANSQDLSGLLTEGFDKSEIFKG